MPFPSASIIVNGTTRTVPEGWKIADLLSEVGMPPERVAVEVNQQIVDRREYVTKPLQSGDRVEIITFVGGGR
ncbi:MAG: sulfur carrier protein ThiS [Nitrospirota bacterium]